MKRALLFLLAVLALVPLLVVGGFYAYENWTGDAAWRRIEATLRAAGEPLTIEALRPEPVPDAQNMAAAPVFRELFTYYNPQLASVHDVQLPPRASVLSTAEESSLIRLARRFRPDFAGDAAAAAQVVRDGLAPMEPLLDAIRAAAERPETVWPARTARGLELRAPLLSPLRRASEVLSARATASFAGHDSGRALADFELITRLARRPAQPASLAGSYASLAMLTSALDIVAEGLAHGAWSDADLRRIGDVLADLRMLDEFREGVRGERALVLATPDALMERAEAIFTFIDFRSPASEWITSTLCRLAWQLRPSGWNARDRANYAALSQDWLGLVIHNDFVRPWALAEWNARIRSVRMSPLESFRTPMTMLAIPGLATAARAAAYTQARLDFTRLACAIERHRRETGAVPPDLDALVPRWIDRIPRDVVAGGPYFYRARGAEAYTIYGKGWNARDDGGSGANANALLGPATADDWVWTSSAIARVP